MSDERIYPCDDCGVMRSKAEGGTVFSVCDVCWEKRCEGELPSAARNRLESDVTRLISALAAMQAERDEARAERNGIHDALTITQRECVRRDEQLVAATTERAEAVRKLSMLADEHKTLQADLRDERAKLAMVRAKPDDVWFWQGDGHDHPKSLTCPVVMEAAVAMRLAAERDEARAECQRMKHVFEAAVEWHAAEAATNDVKIEDDKMRSRKRERFGRAWTALRNAIDSALAQRSGK